MIYFYVQVLFHPNSGDTPKIGEIDTLRMGPYKVYWKTGGSWSACDGSVAPLQEHDPPLVFDVAFDLSETIPLSQESFPDLENVS